MGLKAVLGAVIGGFIGFSLGGPLGAIQGASQGFVIGLAFEDTKLPPGPRLEDIKQNISQYGETIPRVYGREQVTGNIIWMNNNELSERVEEETIEESAIFGDTTQTVYKYSATFAVLLCEGVIDGVTKIWANDEVIYDAGGSFGNTGASLFSGGEVGSSTKAFSAEKIANREAYKAAQAQNGVDVTFVSEKQVDLRIYKGTLTQDIDPAIEAALGENSSAYRGIAYVVFDNLQLSNSSYQNRIPTLRFEVKRTKTDTDIVDGDVRTFVAEYESVTVSGIEQGITLQVLSLNTQQVGSIMGNLGPVSLKQNRYKGLLINDAYHYSNGILYSMYKITTNDASVGVSKLFNYQYEYPNAETTTYINQLVFPILLQAHDTVNLAPIYLDGSLDPFQQSTNLINEQVVYPFPFDMQDTIIPGQEPIFKPIQNLPNWVIAARGEELQIGFVQGDRLALWNLGINLGEPSNSGKVNHPSPNFKSDIGVVHGTSNLRCVFLGGLVYIYSSLPDVSGRVHFPGVIRVDIEGLATSRYTLRDVIKVPKNSILNTGNNSFIEETTVDTYRVIATTNEELLQKTLTSDRVVWNTDIIINEIGYDYENDKLYGLIRKIPGLGVFDGNNISSTYTDDPTLLNIETENLMRLDRTTLEIIESNKYISDKGLINTPSGEEARVPNTSINCFRVYEDKYVDVAHSIYKLESNREDSYYVYSNSNSYLDGNTVYNSTTGTIGEASNIYNPIANRQSSSYQLLPDLSVTGTERANLFTASHGDFSGANAFSPINEIQRQIVTLNGSVEDLFNGTPNIQVGELLNAEIRRQRTIDVATEVDFSRLDTTIKGIAIKDRGPLAGTLKALQDTYLFDVVEKDYKITGENRADKTITRTIEYTDLSAGESSTSPEFKITTPRRGEVPSKYYITYRNPDLDYNVDTIIWQDPSVDTNISLNVKLPVVLTANDSYNIVRRIALSTISARQGSVAVTTTFKHSDLDLGDFVTFNLSDGSVYTVRIIGIDKGRPGLVKINGIVDNPINYTYDKEGFASQNILPGNEVKIATPIVIDGLPFTEQQDGIGYWVGAYSPNNPAVFDSIASMTDNLGVSLTQGKSLANITSVGFTTNALPDLTTEGDFDYSNDLTFSPIGNPLGFVSMSEEEVLKRETSNTFFYGSAGNWELIKVLNFTVNNDSTITASGILRGYKGTAHLAIHNPGDYIVSAGSGVSARLLTNISNVGSAAAISLIDPSSQPNAVVRKDLEFGSRLPLPPIKLGGYKTAQGAFYVEWTRQARYGIEWTNLRDTTLDEDTEQYKLYLVDTSDNNRILDDLEFFETTSAEITVTDQSIIYGSEQTNISFALAQFSQELNAYGIISDIVTI